MEERKIVVVVEEVEEARVALKWAIENIVRYGDILTLLHVFPYFSSSNKSRNKKKLRLLRLKGYQLALSFKDICSSSSFNTKIEIVVIEDDKDGERIVGFVREIGAFALVLGLHDHSFIYRLTMSEWNMTRTLNCRVLAIKQPKQSSTPTKISTNKSLPSFTTFHACSSNLDFSQIEIAPLQVPVIRPPKIPYQICPNPHAILWRSSNKTRRKQRH